MPLIKDDSERPFAERQVITSRNVAGGRCTELMLGGLNYQIEHHLFPGMPRPNLPKAQGLIRSYCADNDLEYREDSLIGSFRQALADLRQPRSAPL
jgi:fatty acid desaturase